MKYFFIFFLFIPLIYFSQISYNTDDLFSLNNPSANAEKKMVTTGIVRIINLNNLNCFSSFIAHKQKVKVFSFGINSELSKFGILINSKTEAQISYSYRINRKLTWNSGVGFNMRIDNFSTSSSWNPTYFGLNAGMSLVSKKWKVGFSMVNLNQVNRMIDTFKIHVDSYFTLYGSYDFKLDSIGNYHFIPSLYLDRSSSGFYYSLLNLKFNFFNHSTGLSYTRFQPSIFYQHHFKQGLSIGFSIGKYLSILNNNSDSWNAMVRLNYSLKRKKIICIGTPSF